MSQNEVKTKLITSDELTYLTRQPTATQDPGETVFTT